MSTLKNLSTQLFVLVLVALLSSCATMRAHSDYDPQADFGQFETYAWISEDPLIQPPGRDDQYISPLTLKRIQDAIQTELSAKGYRLADNRGEADFTVSFTVGARDRIEVDAYPSYYRGRWPWRWHYYGEVDVDTYTEGSLAIDIFDNNRRQPVWHGSVRKRITGSDMEDSGPAIKKAVAAILKMFPPA